MKPEQGSITHWLQELKSGQSQAAEAIWLRYYPKLVLIASRRLTNNPDRAVEGADLVQSSFRNVCLAVIDGKYPDIENRVELWNLLYVATLNRVRQHFRELNTKKRAHYEVSDGSTSNPSPIENLQCPQAAVEMADLLEHLLQKLDTEDPTGELRQIAILHLEDHSASSIAKILRRRKITILISLRLIRSLWEEYQTL